MATNPYFEKADAEFKKFQADVQSRKADLEIEDQMRDAQNQLTALREAGEDAAEDARDRFEESMKKLRSKLPN